MTRDQVAAWVRAYECAWRTAGTEPVRRLFSGEATYQLSPYEEPIVGLDAIAVMWDRERTGPDERFTMSSEIVAVEVGTAVVYLEVLYDGPPPRQYRDLWVLRFDEAGRCREFQEWPFWPGQPLTALG
jgi:hypothetical protein